MSHPQLQTPKQTVIFVLLIIACCEALSPSYKCNRRTMVQSTISGSTILLLPTLANAKSMPPTYSSQPIQGRGGSETRIEGIGGGLDLTRSTVPPNTDVIFPASSLGSWTCQRIVTSVEGDAGQAELAWRCLGGPPTGDWKGVEKYKAELVLPPKESIENTYMFEGKMLEGVVLDRGLELEARSKDRRASWEVTNPTNYSYEQDGRVTELNIVQRKIDLPSEQGFGSNEVYRITTAAGGIFGDGNKVQRAIRVQRRYRRAFDGDGNRIIEAVELVKTYRVLDGVAGELPTSSTKSMIRWSQL